MIRPMLLPCCPGGGGVKPKPQAVFYTAHYDHLGIDRDMKGDNIYNGAADNATGCGILLEIARAYASSSVKPPHAVYFAAVTAEEQGGLQLAVSRHASTGACRADIARPELRYADAGRHSERDLARPGRSGRVFTRLSNRPPKPLASRLEPDPRPRPESYYRSDHFSFARVGIPAFSIEQGTLFEGQTPEWGKAQFDDYVAHHYHQPSDEYREVDGFSRQRQAGAFPVYSRLGGLVAALGSSAASREMSLRRRVKRVRIDLMTIGTWPFCLQWRSRY